MCRRHAEEALRYEQVFDNASPMAYFLFRAFVREMGAIDGLR